MKLFRLGFILFVCLIGISSCKDDLIKKLDNNTSWYHSYEDDKGDTLCFRPENYKFPLSRGRQHFSLKQNGDFIYYAISPRDGYDSYAGTWKMVDGKTEEILVEFSGKDEKMNFGVKIISFEEEKLKILMK